MIRSQNTTKNVFLSPKSPEFRFYGLLDYRNLPIMEKMEKVSYEVPYMKNVLVVCVLSLLTITSAFALGSKDTIDTPVENLDSWLETVDVSDQKPGKYNILITAEDLAGNQGFAGPFNMYIDPDSDLPVTQITNPLNGMRVPGNLNIV